MSQHDFDIANQSFPAFRADLNDALKALASSSSGGTAPTPTYAGQLWMDTAAGVLKIRNSGNTGWINIGDSISAANLGLALLNSPAFTGQPTAPTSNVNEDSDRIATTAFVFNNFIIQGVTGGVVFTARNNYRVCAQTLTGTTNANGQMGFNYPQPFGALPSVTIVAGDSGTGGDYIPIVFNPATSGVSFTAWQRANTTATLANAIIRWNYIAIGVV